jgi:hypothetical protein
VDASLSHELSVKPPEEQTHETHNKRASQLLGRPLAPPVNGKPRIKE